MFEELSSGLPVCICSCLFLFKQVPTALGILCGQRTSEVSAVLIAGTRVVPRLSQMVWRRVPRVLFSALSSRRRVRSKGVLGGGPPVPRVWPHSAGAPPPPGHQWSCSSQRAERLLAFSARAGVLACVGSAQMPAGPGLCEGTARSLWTFLCGPWHCPLCFSLMVGVREGEGGARCPSPVLVATGGASHWKGQLSVCPVSVCARSSRYSQLPGFCKHRPSWWWGGDVFSLAGEWPRSVSLWPAGLGCPGCGGAAADW